MIKNLLVITNTFAKIGFEKLIFDIVLIDFVNIAKYRIYN
jgi:hypothetical protein